MEIVKFEINVDLFGLYVYLGWILLSSLKRHGLHLLF